MKPGAPTGSLDVRFDRNGMVWVGSMMQGSLVKFDPKTEKFVSWGMPDFLKRNDARIAMVMPEQTHLDGKVWIGAENEYQVDIASGEWTEIDYKKLQPPGARITARTASPRTRRTISTASNSMPTTSSGSMRRA